MKYRNVYFVTCKYGFASNICIFKDLIYLKWVPTHAQTDLHKLTCASPFFGVNKPDFPRFSVVCASILAQTTQNLGKSGLFSPKNGLAQVCLCRSVCACVGTHCQKS